MAYAILFCHLKCTRGKNVNCSCDKRQENRSMSPTFSLVALHIVRLYFYEGRHQTRRWQRRWAEVYNDDVDDDDNDDVIEYFITSSCQYTLHLLHCLQLLSPGTETTT